MARFMSCDASLVFEKECDTPTRARAWSAEGANSVAAIVYGHAHVFSP